MNTNKILGILLTGLLTLPFIAGAAYDDVSLTSDAVISVNSLSIGVSSDSATAIESITISASSFTVTLQANSTFLATSSARATFDVESPNPIQQSKPCTSAESGITLSGVGSQTTVTISPSSTVCSDTGSSSSSSGSGSSGGIIVGLIGSGGGGSTAAAPATPAPTPASQPAVSGTFALNLSSGDENDDVTRLQTFLAADPSVYPEGKVTCYFGSLTAKAVGKFQEKYGIAMPGDAGYGNFGPKTRAKLNELISGVPAVSTPGVPAATPTSGSFSKGLKVGQSDLDVQLLQQLLNRDPDTIVAASGAGSPGNETNYFGNATKAAVGKFQEKYGIAAPGDSAYGYVGTKTRTKLNELMQ